MQPVFLIWHAGERGAYCTIDVPGHEGILTCVRYRVVPHARVSIVTAMALAVLSFVVLSEPQIQRLPGARREMSAVKLPKTVDDEMCDTASERWVIGFGYTTSTPRGQGEHQSTRQGAGLGVPTLTLSRASLYL